MDSSTRRKSSEYMTQDCIEWDESKNLDLRTLTSPDMAEMEDSRLPTRLETPSHGAVPPAAKKIRTSTRQRPEPGCIRDADQEINEIFCRLQQNEEQRTKDRASMEEEDDEEGAPTPRLDNKSSSRQSKVKDVASRMVTWSEADIDRRRQQREAAVKVRQRRQLKQQAGFNLPPHQLNPIPADENALPNMEGPSGFEGLRKLEGPSGFEGLLKQIQTPPPPTHVNKSTAVIKPSESQDLATASTSSGATWLATGSPQHRPARVPLQQLDPQRQTPGRTTTTLASMVKPVMAVSHLIDSTEIHISVEEPHQPLPLTPPAATSSLRDAIVEFDDIEFSVDDLEALDSLVLAATSSSQETKGHNIENQFDRDSKPNNLRKALSASTAASTILSVDSEPSKVDADCFDEFPDVDFEALDRSIKERQSRAGKIHQHLPDNIQQHQLNLQRADLTVPPADAPIRNKRVHRAPVSSSLAPHMSYLSFSRYKVVNVEMNVPTFTKSLFVAAWTSRMLDSESNKAIHRRDEYGRADAVKTISSGPRAWPVDGVVHLRGEWYHTRVEAGDPIHICSLMGEFRTDPSALPLLLHTAPPPGSDPDDLMLIMHPDLLLTPTTISETVSCTRRAVLKNRLGSTGLTSKAALLGTLRHELFEATMKDRDFSITSARGHARSILRENAEGLIASQTTTAEAERELLAFVPQLQHFADSYTNLGPRGAKSRSQLIEIENTMMRPSVRFVAQHVQAIEEPVISPELGLKGNLDLVARATLAQLDPQSSSSEALIGIELKTGHIQKTQHAHVAQLALYVLMMHARYGSGNMIPSSAAAAAATSGLLLYMNGDSVRAIHVAPLLSEMKSLIGQRNVVANEQIRMSKPRGIIISYETENNGSPNKRMRCDNVESRTTKCTTPIGLTLPLLVLILLSIDLTEPPPALLPEVLSCAHLCSKCYANRECMVYAASAQSAVTTHSSHVDFVQQSHGDMLKSFTGHLGQDDFAFFLKWDRLIDLESDMDSCLPALSWLETAEEKEKRTATTVSSLVYDAKASSSKSIVRESRYAVIALKRSPDSASGSFQNLSIQPGSHVIISSDRTSLETIPLDALPRPQMHIVRGFLHRITDSHLLVRASNGDLERIEYYARSSNGCENVFRIDLEDSPVGVGTLRQNLINLLIGDKDPEASNVHASRLSRLRDVIIRLRPPIFDNTMMSSMFSPTCNCPSVPGCDLSDLAIEFIELNPGQKAAVEKVMTTNQYCLVQGMPGTGKTSLITFVARLLAAHGKRVLITAYTHAAVDNVMLKLIQAGVSTTPGNRGLSPLVRIGQKSSCHTGVYPVLASEIALSMEQGANNSSLPEPVLPSAESLHRCMQAARLVGVTALSVPRSSLLHAAQFDVVIVDEAGQISQPTVIGALMAADSFVLVGDHMQLPPIVKSELASKGGMAVSLMKSLADAHPNCVSQLTYQYRMHEKICELSNDIAYGGRLKCANDKVRFGKLHLPGFPQSLLATATPPHTSWLNKAIDPKAVVVFLDTDGIGFTETTQGGSIINQTEATIVQTTVAGLIACGLAPDSVGIICPFRAQLRILEDCSLLRRLRRYGLEMSTIDRYQGRDKAVIVVSFVRSNTKGRVGRLLDDYRRLNVAITRAKFKLILIGSYSTLYEGSKVLRPALVRIKNSDGVLHLPESATTSYIALDLPAFAQASSHDNDAAIDLDQH